MTKQTNSKEKLYKVAERQQGFFTASQAVECGYLWPNLGRFLKSGEWIREERGIYRLSYYPPEERPELVIWSLWSRGKKSGPQGVWSYETALDIYGITDVMPSKMHMTVPKGFRRSTKIPTMLHLHYEDLSEEETKCFRGYRVSTPIKSLLDVLESGMHPKQVATGFIEALRKGLLTRKVIENSSLCKTDQGLQIMEQIKNADV